MPRTGNQIYYRYLIMGHQGSKNPLYTRSLRLSSLLKLSISQYPGPLLKVKFNSNLIILNTQPVINMVEIFLILMFWITISLPAIKPLIKFKWLPPQLLNVVINSKEPNDSEYKKHLLSAGPQNKGQCSILKNQYPVISDIRHCSLFSGGTLISQDAWHRAGWRLAVDKWQFAVRFELLVGFLPDFEFSCVYPIGIEHGHGAFSCPMPYASHPSDLVDSSFQIDG